MKRQIKNATVLLTVSLFTMGVLGSVANSSVSTNKAQLFTETFVPTDTETGTDTGTSTEDWGIGRVLVPITCAVTVYCPSGPKTKSGFSMQCAGSAGPCHSSQEKVCDATPPTCQ